MEREKDNWKSLAIPYLSYSVIPIFLSRFVSRAEAVPERRQGFAPVGECCGENKDVTRPYLRVVK